MTLISLVLTVAPGGAFLGIPDLTVTRMFNSLNARANLLAVALDAESVNSTTTRLAPCPFNNLAVAMTSLGLILLAKPTVILPFTLLSAVRISSSFINRDTLPGVSVPSRIISALRVTGLALTIAAIVLTSA